MKSLRLQCLAVLTLIALVSVNAQAATAASPVGRWAGIWTSQSTGHSGTLRARIRQVDSQTYRALFAGRFAKVIPFVYPAKLNRLAGTASTYTSSTRLPLLGTYTMRADVSGQRFYATFRGRKDSGVFDMRRR